MNSDILAGISKASYGELPLKKSDSSSSATDFLSLLQHELGGNQLEDLSVSNFVNTHKVSYSGMNVVNPLLTSNQFKSERFEERPAAYNDVSDQRPDTFANSRRFGKTDQRQETKSLDDAKATAESDDSERSSRRNENLHNRTDEEKAAGKDNAAKAGEVTPEKADSISEEENVKNEKFSSTIVDAANPDGSTDSVASLKSDAANAENTKQTPEQKAAILAEMEKLLEDFPPEERANMMEILEKLSQQDLEAIAESPAEFNEALTDLLENMPESTTKTELLAIVESPEFSRFLQALADQQQMTTDNELSASTNEESVTAPLADELSEESKSLNAEETETNQENVADSMPQEGESSENIIAQTEETAKDSAKEKESEPGDRSTHREMARNTAEKNAETDLNQQPAERSANEESLREEFKRLNQATSGTSENSEQTDMADENLPTNKSTLQTNVQTVTPEQAKSASEEAAKKFFSMFSDKSNGGEKIASETTYSPEAVKRHSGMNNNSAGNGSNGFSSHTGTSASSTNQARPATPVPAANHIFSQMLEKAEYLKTQNGSKILNMELDPGELGKLEMELTSRDGTVSARISAESALAKARLEELAPQIKEQLLNQGVNLTEITVDISSRNPDERNRNQMFGNKNRSSRLQATGKASAEEIIRKNVLPNLRRAALNIKAVDLTV